MHKILELYNWTNKIKLNLLSSKEILNNVAHFVLIIRQKFSKRQLLQVKKNHNKTIQNKQILKVKKV